VKDGAKTIPPKAHDILLAVRYIQIV